MHPVMLRGTRVPSFVAALGTAQPVRLIRSSAARPGDQPGEASRPLPTAAEPLDASVAGQAQQVPVVEALRFAVSGSVPLKSAHGVLLADEVHRAVARKFTGDRAEGPSGPAILGSRGVATDHQHAHWVPVAAHAAPDAPVQALIVWVPLGLRPPDVAAIVALRSLPGRPGRGGDRPEAPGLPPVGLSFQAAGPVAVVAPELCGPSRRWRSLTPYLPVRHRKRESLDDFVSTDVATELRYRGLAPAVVTRTGPDRGLPDRWARDFRRYRLNERPDRSRPGLGLQLDFTDPVTGPLLLGQLSHYGYGIFQPVPG